MGAVVSLGTSPYNFERPLKFTSIAHCPVVDIEICMPLNFYCVVEFCVLPTFAIAAVIVASAPGCLRHRFVVCDPLIGGQPGAEATVID
jgi:hypothetical protein